MFSFSAAPISLSLHNCSTWHAQNIGELKTKVKKTEYFSKKAWKLSRDPTVNNHVCARVRACVCVCARVCLLFWKASSTNYRSLLLQLLPSSAINYSTFENHTQKTFSTIFCIIILLITTTSTRLPRWMSFYGPQSAQIVVDVILLPRSRRWSFRGESGGSDLLVGVNLGEFKLYFLFDLIIERCWFSSSLRINSSGFKVLLSKFQLGLCQKSSL